MKKILFGLAIIWLFVPLMAQTNQYDLSAELNGSRNAKVDLLFEAWNSSVTPGAAVAVIKDGAIVYAKGYGMANLEYGIPITPSTVFHIASVSKQFTAFSVLLLEKEGKLSLDEDVRKYIPEVPDFGRVITLRHLIYHMSGLRDQWNLLIMAGRRLDDVITQDQILKMVYRQKDLNFDPAEQFLYCNTGFTLLAEVVERVSGKSFVEFTNERIFKPLGMTSTFFYDSPQKIVTNRAYSYAPDSSDYRKAILSYATVGATSLFTTVEDLSKWVLNFKNIRVGDTDVIEKMNTQGVLSNGNEILYASGQFLEQYKGLNRIAHGGADAGYRAYLARFPDQHFSVALLSNVASIDAESLAMKIADIYLEDALKAANNQYAESIENGTFIRIEPETLNAYTGQYDLYGTVIEIINEEKGLFLQMPGEPVYRLFPVSEREFILANPDSVIDVFSYSIIFHSTGNLRPESMSYYQKGQLFDCIRIEPYVLQESDLAQYAGVYYSEELPASYELVIENGQLIAKHPWADDIRFTPLLKDVFAGSRPGALGRIEILRDDAGLVTGFKASNTRVRDLLFRKL